MYVVTGASSGIGLAISQLLIQEGQCVLGIARDFSQTPALDPVFFTAFECDLSEITALPSHLEQLCQRYSEIKGLILCAGQGRFGAFENISYDQMAYILNLNLLSPMMAIKAFLPALRSYRNTYPEQAADIVLIGSESALLGAKQGALYCASKFGVRGMAQSLRKDCLQHGIRVGCVHPGAVDTDFFDTLHFQPVAGETYAISPNDVALSVMHMLSLPATVVLEEMVLQPLKQAWAKK